MSRLESLNKLEKWIDSYLNFEKTPKKNIFWLDTMKFFCEKFGHPEKFAPCFHVGGSKGKGSISTFIASILDEAGYRTGIYTSPHILDFIERIASASGYFEDEAYDRAVEEIMKGVQQIKTEELPGGRPVTWFELVTLFGFLTFRQAKVDYSVYEVGLGGRLDSTNVIDPVCACIGPIELEHTEFLGDTIEKIAEEKAGIIKKNGTVIIAAQKPTVRKVFEDAARKNKAEAVFIEDAVKDLKFHINPVTDSIKNHTSLDNNNKNSLLFYTSSQENTPLLMKIQFSSEFFTRQISCTIQMIGKYQAENAALAAVAVKKAIPSITEEQIERGLSKAKLPARFEIQKNPGGFEQIPYLILDGAHTVNSVNFTMETIRELFKNSRDEFSLNLLFACAADKDAKDIAPIFRNQFKNVFLTKPGNIKAADLQGLKKAFNDAKIEYDIEEDFERQIKKALEISAVEKSVLLITGSFYLVSEAKKILSKSEKL